MNEDAGFHKSPLAKLFYRSGWTQEKLAKAESVKPKVIERQLRFGRFLNFVQLDEKLKTFPANLNAGRFRSFWERIGKFAAPQGFGSLGR